MAISDFEKQLNEAGNNLLAAAKSSLDWFKDKIDNFSKKNINDIFKKTAMPEIGSMYLFVYDPKYKDTLPFYDMFPLVIPIEFQNQGFLGLNLHYLPPAARSSLLSALATLANNDKYNDTTKLTISYEIVKRYSSQFPGNTECIKRYLYGHVRSQFQFVSPSDWAKVVTMPLQKWKINPNKKYAGSPPY
jgi:hypothetical protein